MERVSLTDDEFDILYDKERDIITVGETEFSCEFFRQINSLKVDSIHIVSMKVDYNRNLNQVGPDEFLVGREDIKVEIVAQANYRKK
jgi:hypothetical protein